MLDPDVVARSDSGTLRPGSVVRGAAAVAGQAITYAHLAQVALPALVNGAAGVVEIADGRPLAVMAFTVTGGRIAEINILTDPERLDRLDLTVLDA